MWPAIIGGAIGALGSIIGGRSQAKAQEEANAQNIAMQREFAQQGIRWRVEDAKAAGLHPLFALGGSGATFSPSAQPVFNSGIGPALQSMGQGVQRAIAAQSTEAELAERQARLKLIEAQTNESNARAASMLAASENARLNQAQVATFPLGYHPSDVPTGISSRQLAAENQHYRMGLEAVIPGQGGSSSSVPISGAVKVKPSEVTSHAVGDESRAAGRSPVFKEFTLWDRPGRTPVRMLLPEANSASEALESIGESREILYGVVAANIRAYGWGWVRDVINGGGRLAHAVQSVVSPRRDLRFKGPVGR